MKKLPKKWVEVLRNLPENGMGYHIVDIYVNHGVYRDAMIFNCEELAKDLPFKEEDITDITQHRL